MTYETATDDLWGAEGLEQHRFQVAQLPLNIFENGAVLGRGPGVGKKWKSEETSRYQIYAYFKHSWFKHQ